MLPGNNYIAVDWDGSSIRMLQFKKERSGAINVVRSTVRTIESTLNKDDPETFAAFLRETMQSEGITGSSVIFTVGREKSFLHNLAIPATPEGQVANLVRFQLAQELPFAIEESAVDYVITSRDEKKLVTSVLAAAVRTEYLDYLQHVAKSAGLTLRRAGLKPYANFLTCREMNLIGEESLLFVDLNPSGLEIDVFTPVQQILFSRNIGLSEGQAEPLSQEQYLDQALLQFKRTMSAHAYQFGTSAEQTPKVIVSGNTGCEEMFLARLKEQMKMDGSVFSFSSAIPEVKNETSMVAVYGLSIGQFRPREDQFDFLFPKRAVDPQAVRARYIRLAVAGLALLMILGFVFSNAIQRRLQTQADELTLQTKELDVKMAKFKKFSAQAGQVQNWMDKKVNWLDQLSVLTEAFPGQKDIFVKHVFMAESLKAGMLADVSIEGQSKNRNTIDKIAQNFVDKFGYKVSLGQVITLSGEEYPENFKLNLLVGKSKMKLPDNSTSKPDATSKPGTKPASSTRKGAVR